MIAPKQELKLEDNIGRRWIWRCLTCQNVFTTEYGDKMIPIPPCPNCDGSLKGEKDA